MESFKGIKRVREYWQRYAQSIHCKMSRGAENITRTISRARNENWRRNSKKNEK